MEEGKGTSPHPGGFGNIVLCVDSSEASASASEFVRCLAKPDARVAVIALMPGLMEAVRSASTGLADTAMNVRTRVIDLAKEGGDVARAITREALDEHIDLLLVVMRQHHGLVRWFDPSVLDRLGRLSPCAMVVVPAEHDVHDAGSKRILFAIDGSPSSFAALDTGVVLATPDTHIRVVYVVDRALRGDESVPKALLEDALAKEGERAIAAALGRLRTLPAAAQSQVSADVISTDISDDDISSVLLREAKRWDADLMVMGTHGRRGDARSYLGSVPNRVASLARIRLMLVRERHGGSSTNTS